MPQRSFRTPALRQRTSFRGPISCVHIVTGSVSRALAATANPAVPVNPDSLPKSRRPTPR